MPTSMYHTLSALARHFGSSALESRGAAAGPHGTQVELRHGELGQSASGMDLEAGGHRCGLAGVGHIVRALACLVGWAVRAGTRVLKPEPAIATPAGVGAA